MTYAEDILTRHGTLAHHGIRGMRWGIRRRSGGDSSGGTHAPSQDALTAKASLQKAQKHGSSSLTNHEMQALVNRMNLERNFAKLTVKKDSAAKAYIKELLIKTGKQEVKSLTEGKMGPVMAEISSKLAGKGAHMAVKSAGKHMKP